MPRQPTGTEIIAAMIKATTWGTLVDPDGAGNGVLLLNESLTYKPEILFDDSLGEAFDKCSDPGNIDASGDMEANLRYEGLMLPLAIALGEAGVPSLLTDGYEHVLNSADNIYDLFMTLAIDKITKIHTFPSVKVTGFTIRGTQGGYLMVTFNLLANTMDPDSSVTTLSSVTVPMQCGNIVFNNGTFLLKDQGGAAPADPGDKVLPSEFEIAFSRNETGDYVANGTREITEPSADGKPEVTCSLTFPRYTDSRFIEDLFAMQEHEMIATWVGDLIVPPSGTDSYTFQIELPRMVILDADAAVGGLGKIPTTINYRCKQADSTPTGFEDDGPLSLKIINSISTDPLA